MAEWTKEPPTKTGWYWWRDVDLRAEPVIVSEVIGQGLVVAYHLKGNGAGVADIRGEWWPEPIREPQ